MKVLITTSSHPYKSSGIVALDLFNELRKNDDNEIKMIVKEYANYPDNNILSYESALLKFINKIVRKIQRILEHFKFRKKTTVTTHLKYGFKIFDQTIDYCSIKKIIKKIRFTPDAILVLFNVKFLSYKNLYELNKITGAPILLYMMDMAPLTGGCHYAWKCKEYYKKCGNCPALYSSTENDQSRKNWEFKNRYIKKTNMIAIAGTEWQYQQLSKSSLYRDKQKYKIMLSVDHQLFLPGNSFAAISFFKLPQGKKIIFFGAVSVLKTNKGFAELIKSLNILKQTYTKNEIHLAIAGNVQTELINNLPFEYTLLGFLNHSDLAQAFQAADLFLCPSVEDSGPMMINQSIMCGTPVVAFEMGVALDLVITGKTGYRAKLKDSDDLAKGIDYILSLNEIEYNKMSKNCRNLGLERLHVNKQSEDLENLLENIKKEVE